MAISLLDLPDEALRVILLSLGSDVLTDSDRKYFSGGSIANKRTTPNKAQCLANCCRRLDAIYRTSVCTLTLYKSYSVSTCARLWDRFPQIATLHIDFTYVPGFALSDFSAPPYPAPWRSEHAAFPNGLVRNGVKEIRLHSGIMQVRELHEMVENCTGLEELCLRSCRVLLEREHAGFTDQSAD